MPKAETITIWYDTFLPWIFHEISCNLTQNGHSYHKEGIKGQPQHRLANLKAETN